MPPSRRSQEQIFKSSILILFLSLIASISLNTNSVNKLTAHFGWRKSLQAFQSKALLVPSKFASSSFLSRMSGPQNRTPVYFFSHGGPSVMYNTSHPVYSRLSHLGREITTKVKPKAIVVFSAHWEAEKPGMIEVNTAVSEPLIYDFYGFPAHYYKAKFLHKGSPEVAARVMELLKEAGIKAEGVERGLDHGVWAAFSVAFDPESNPLGVPIVQVSLYDIERGATTEDARKHIYLGRAVAKLREEGVLIIVSGMAVHNLRDMRFGGLGGGAFQYTETFDEALKEAVEREPGEQRDIGMAGILERADARKAHPTFEHLLPIHIGVGAAGQDRGERLWTLKEGSMSWAQYRFGNVEA